MSGKNKFTKTKQPQYKVINKKIASIIFSLLLPSSPFSWADSPLTIKAEVDKPIVTTGDIITYSITLKHELDVIPTAPDFDKMDGFEIIERSTSIPKKIKEKTIEQKYSVKLRADKVGKYTITSNRIPFKIKKKDGEKYIPGEVRPPKVSVEVASILRLQGEPTDIKGIKDIVEVDKDWVPWFFWGLNLILLTIVLHLLWKYRKAKHPNPTEKVAALSVHEAAFRELDILESKGLLEHGNAREHFCELSEIFRRYLGKRYLFPAPDWTTEEIAEHFKNQKKIALVSCEEATRILKKSDLVKFAKANALPEADELKPVRNFIRSTQENLKMGLYSN